jgi:hypothetical protein
MSKNNSVAAFYPSQVSAEEAVKELRQSSFDLKKASIVGRDYLTDEHVVGYYNVGNRMKARGKTGAFWGGECSSVQHSSGSPAWARTEPESLEHHQ